MSMFARSSTRTPTSCSPSPTKNSPIFLKEGKVVFARDTDLLYVVAFRTAQGLEDFKPTMDTSRRWLVLDRERILVKIDELEGYVRDLRTIAPQNFTEYQQIEKTREKPAEKEPHCERGN